MATWEEIRDEVAGMLADGEPLEDVIAKLEKLKNEMAKANLIAVMDEMKKPKPMTEEEWLRTATTEELVQAIHLMTSCCYVCGKDGVDYKRCYFHKKCTGPKEIEEWLKEPHNSFE